LPRDRVIYTYVKETDKKITDIISFYYLPSTILKSKKYKKIHAGYSYYNVCTTESLHTLMRNALILSKKMDFDVFNALDILENEKSFKDLNFHGGSGNLNFYVYNWNLVEKFKPCDVGIVLL